MERRLAQRSEKVERAQLSRRGNHPDQITIQRHLQRVLCRPDCVRPSRPRHFHR
ncbi:hypothetical protein BKA80DRAFT_279131 [Phyllosticta citrichinensis]